jgi:ABC-type glutathione transport system ATPase component
MTEILLEARGLSLALPTPDGPPRLLLDEVDLAITRGEAVGLVGSSGSGKTLTALSLLGLWPHGAQVRGEIHLAGCGDLIAGGERLFRQVRGRRLALIFQDTLAALNPLLTIGSQIAEAIQDENGARERRRRCLELLESVALPDPAGLFQAFPHQLSGGQRQRVLLAIALAGSPDLLIADEPTTALDLTIQAQILELLRVLRARHDLALLLITHDFAVVAQECDRALEMAGGRIVAEHRADQLSRLMLTESGAVER